MGSSIVCSTILFSIPLKYRMYNFYPRGAARFEPERYSYFVGVTLGYFDENNNTIPIFIRYLRWLGVVEKPVYGFWEDTGIPPYNTSGVFQGDLGNSWYWIGPGVWVGRNITDLFSERYILHSAIFLLISLCVTLGISFLFLFFRKKRQRLLFFSEKRIRFHFNWLQKHFYIVFLGALVLDFSFSLSKWAGLSFFL
ncbi:MAG: hypothetical protein EU548_03285, partial [Promethearchaeota archaeon]